MEKYTVYVDDNFHHGDSDERYCFGWFESKDLALKAMKLITEDEILSWARETDSAEQLLSQYKGFGEDPYCSGVYFSAWTWAEERCKELTDMSAEELEEEQLKHDREYEEISALRRKD